MEDKRGSIHLGGKQDKEFTEDKEHSVHLSFGEKEMSQITKVPVTLDMDASQEAKAGRTTYEGDLSESGRPLEENDPMRIWKEMKQNGFLSSSHGAIPIPKPKPLGKKSKNDDMLLIKKKREQVDSDRFTKIKIAPPTPTPSGLLNELNPGIIHHVRNRKQVHSFIEALLIRSEKHENISSIIRSTSTTLSNDEPSSNFTNLSSLSLKAATVASQWLNLLHQDNKHRLSALRRSKKRVQSVIKTELPFLISKEFPNNNQETEADLHRARWNALFDYMNEALSEEEKKLETCLNQVKEKQLLCDKALQNVAAAVNADLAVNAAAASIYSTCNLILSELDFGVELDPNSNSKSGSRCRSR